MWIAKECKQTVTLEYLYEHVNVKSAKLSAMWIAKECKQTVTLEYLYEHVKSAKLYICHVDSKRM